MGKPKKGKDSLGPAKQRARRRRVVHVFTEGEVTEPSYIEIIKGHAPTVEVRIANASAPGSQRKPLKLVEAAVKLMDKERREARRGGLTAEYLPQVWCLFDRDEHEGIETALKQAREGGVEVAFSHPCFELWRLLHHKPVTGTFGGVCGLVVQRLPFARDPKDGARLKLVLPHQITGGFPAAKERALRMNAEHGEHVPLVKRDPYTNVHDFVERGLGITKY
ncbi:RloB family protein [Streptomyces sp. WSLK1-5]|uniref:RloB family protein n=1 Tax=unclassified Streptomyces TaxID=2593676 RepID=UPI000F6517FF|nr:RloB family protein [Streptomyces sp. RP5T]RRR75197.1 RloB domain-containing protein [Streptomyces sp. RP5T]